MRTVHLCCYEAKLPTLKLGTLPKQLLGPLLGPLDIQGCFKLGWALNPCPLNKSLLYLPWLLLF